MQVKFCLIDIDYRDVNDKTVILLFGKTIDEKSIVVIDESYEPYFYVLPSDLEKAKKEIVELLEKNNFKIKKIEVEKKNFFGKEKKFLKIYCFKSRDTYKARDIIKRLEAERGGSGSVINEYEYAIGFYRHYLIDRDYSTLDWIIVDGEPVDMDFDADLVLKAKKIEKLDIENLPTFKVLAFDIEVVEEDGKQKVVMISLYAKNFKKVLTYKHDEAYPNWVEVVADEKELLQKFVEEVKAYDPDIIIGFNSDLYDFDVLAKRAEELKVSLTLSRDRSPVRFSRRARVSTARLKGRVHIDIFNFINNILSPILQTEVLTLDAVSVELLGDEKIEMEYEEILEAWKKSKDLAKFAEYCLKDSELAYRLAELLLSQIFELTKLVGQSLFDVSRMTYSQLVEWYYSKKAKETNRIIPNQPKFEEIQRRRRVTYVGGYVKEPEAGLHENIAVIDFASLYPTIIASFNISIETLNCECCKGDGYKVPDLPYWFCKKKRGFESEIIKDLLFKRWELKKKLKKLPKDSHEYVILNAREKSLKTVTNASYGYYAFPASKWYSKECGESTAAWGRYWIKKIEAEAEKNGFKVIYIDTDSCFIKLGNKTKNNVLKFLEETNKKLPGIMRIDLEDFYVRGIFIPRGIAPGTAKKRYALLDERGYLKIRGLEKVRRDWSRIAKETQEEVLRLVLGKKDIKGAIAYVRQIIQKLRNLQVSLRELVIYEQITKPLNEYKQISPHVIAARKLITSGIPVVPGSVIGFVITKGSGSISQRAEPVEFVKLEDIDIEYYITNQILPAALRILKVLGVDEKQLLAPSGLEKFLAK
jgi:DNA polymerase I/DNA polymerase-2